MLHTPVVSAVLWPLGVAAEPLSVCRLRVGAVRGAEACPETSGGTITEQYYLLIKKEKKRGQSQMDF